MEWSVELAHPTESWGKEATVDVPLLLLMQTESVYAFPSDLSLISPISSISTASSTVIDPAMVNVLCLFVDADDVWAAALQAQHSY